MKKAILLSILLVILNSCVKEEVNILQEGTGNWRLESISYPMINKTITYEKVNIVFSFDKNSVIVSGNDGSFYIENGTYSYSLAGNENDGYTMRIGEREYPCSFEKDKMIFSWAHVDGEVITFKKLYFL